MKEPAKPDQSEGLRQRVPGSVSAAVASLASKSSPTEPSAAMEKVIGVVAAIATPPSTPQQRSNALKGYMSLEHQVGELTAEKEDLQRFLQEQLDQLRENVNQVVANVDQFHQTCIARIHRFDSEFVEKRAALNRRPANGVDVKASGSAVTKPHPGKVFRSRDSRLNVLLQIKDIATVYNIFVAILPILFVSLAAQSYFETGKFVDFSLMYNAFSRVDVVAVSWCVGFSYTVAGYGWKNAGKWMSPTVETALYITYQVVFAMAAGLVTLAFKVPAASGFIIMCEQARMAMKVHSFWREHSPTAREKDRLQSAENKAHVPLDKAGMSEYLYVYILFKRFLLPIVQIPLHEKQDDLQVFLKMALNSMFPSMVLFVFGFFGILHCWLNLWAELLQFSDREFYRDWWNSHSFTEYYRKWNGVVYDWLFTYIYLDVVTYFEARYKKSTAKLLSAICVIEVSLNKSQQRSQNTNVFVWAMLLIGTGLLVTLYSRELYIRQSHVSNASITEARFWSEFFTSYSLRTLIPPLKV
ncbi:Sterol O-acyltransferase 1 [Irineochytrium annulatum]|nr:Sterol O-acyltransferase 1 [Irineochytrium annulatum]